jgi:hypothetical protein
MFHKRRKMRRWRWVVAAEIVFCDSGVSVGESDGDGVAVMVALAAMV